METDVLKSEWDRCSGIRDYFLDDYEAYVRWSKRMGGGGKNQKLKLKYLEWLWVVDKRSKPRMYGRSGLERRKVVRRYGRETIVDLREVGHYEEKEGKYSLSELTEFEKRAIKNSTRRAMEETAKKYNTSVRVVYSILGSKPINEDLRHIFKDGTYYQYKNLNRCVLECGYDRKKIEECLSGDRERYKGGKWRWVYKQNYRFKGKREDNRNMSCKNKGRAIVQIGLDDKVVGEFTTVKDAARELGISQGNISNVLTGRRVSLLGFKFKYK